MRTQKRPVLVVLLLLLSLVVSACGGGAAPATEATTGTAAAAATTPETEATEAEAEAVTAEPEETTAATTATEETTTASTEETAAGTEATTETATETETTAAEGEVTAQPIGEELDLGALSPDIADPNEPVTINFASWVGEQEGMQQLAERFQELHPNITIEFQDSPAEEITDKLLTQVAGGTAPDVAYLDQGAVGDFATRNALVALDDYIAQSQAVDKDDYIAAWRDAASFEGKMYGLPFDGETTGLFYRTDLFEAAGIEGPPTTWDEFEAAAQKLTNKDEKKYGFILFAPESAYYWYPWLWQAGGTLLSEDGKTI